MLRVPGLPLRFLVCAFLATIAAPAALAHIGLPAGGSGLAAGLSHPFSGLDHMLAMLAVGLWASQLGGRALWQVPLAFVGTMALGALAGAGGLPLPLVESGITASVLVLGLAVAFAARLPVIGAVLLVGVCAWFHGHAHGTEVPAALAGAAYGIGFLISTAVLHAVGIALGLAAGSVRADRVVRVSGAAICGCAALLWIGAL